MFENENEQVESDVSPEPSSEAPSEPAKAAPEKSEASQNNQDTQENVPFHKHPRWIERDNELKSERQARLDLERKYQQMEQNLQRLSQPQQAPQPDKRAAMIERLKGIDPEFAEFVSQLAPVEELKEVRERYAEQERQAYRKEAMSTLDKLHSENKVSDDLKPFYQTAIEAEIRKNPQATLQDLPSIYKSVHEAYAKVIDQVKRQERESYVAAKKADAKAPVSQPKGTAVKTTGQSEWSKNPEEAKAQLIQRVLKQAKASDTI